jgi:hypothetical protein
VLTALSSQSQRRPVAGVWDVLVRVVDSNGDPVADVPTVTITLPDGTTAAPVMTALPPGCGYFYLPYTVAATGRYVAHVVATGNGAADFTVWVEPITPASGMPTLQDLRGPDVPDPDDPGYLGVNSWTDAQITEALEAEAAAQRTKCAVPADYPPDLRSALLRRVARHLAMTRLPLAVLSGDPDVDAVRIFGTDPEIRRLEAGYPRWVIG